jgi:hypothetical protein
MAKAVNLLEEACAIEPGFVPARAGLAVMRFNYQLYLRQDQARAQGDVKKLLDQCMVEAPQIAVTQYANGLFASAFDRNWERSDGAYRQVLAALPSDVKARGNLAINLMVRRRFDEAQQLIDVSRGLEGEQGMFLTRMALHVLQGDATQTIAAADQMLAVAPRQPQALFFKADALGFDLRDEVLTRATIEQMDPMQRTRSGPYLDACIAVASSNSENILHARDALIAAAKAGSGDWFQVVQVDAVLGDAVAGTRHLQLAIDHNEASVQICAAVPRLAALRHNKDFAAQVRRLNLPV